MDDKNSLCHVYESQLKINSRIAMSKKYLKEKIVLY